MAAGPLSLHPALRGWYAAGLRHIYLDDEALANWAHGREELSVAEKAPDARRHGEPVADSYAHRTPPTTHQTPPPLTRPTAPSAMSPSMSPATTQPHSIPSQDIGSYRQTRQAQVQARQEAEQARQVNQVRQGQTAQEQTVQGQAVLRQTESRFAQNGPQASTVPPEQWPKAWQERLAHTMATAKGAPVLWTYWALGEDLSGAPNAPRRDILRQILGALNLPRGTHCFWPIALPREDVDISQDVENKDENSLHKTMELTASAPLFLAGLSILAPRVCVVMGSKALRTILPNSTTGPFQQTEYGRLLFLVLPDMDMLLAERERIPRVVAYLRSALQPFMGRMK